MRILLVEDDARVASFIERGLKEEHYAVQKAADGERAVFLGQTGEYDLVILDLMLPKKNGMEVLAELRGSGMTAPVIFLTARDKLKDKVSALNAGADDYLVKPFSFEELLARVRALLRRKSDQVGVTLALEDLEMDTRRHEVRRGGKEVSLTNREYLLLEYFLQHPGTVVTRAALSEHVWGHDFDTFSNVIDVHMARLRKKIDDGHALKLLHTVRGSGYVLEKQG